LAFRLLDVKMAPETAVIVPAEQPRVPFSVAAE
jgi:hypothetical protein